MVTNPGLNVIIFRASKPGHGRLYENQAEDFKNPCSALPQGLQSENLISVLYPVLIHGRQGWQCYHLNNPKKLSSDDARVKTNYNFFHQQTLLVPCFHLFLLKPQTVQSLSTPEKRNEGTEKVPHSSPQLPPRSPQYSRWRPNTGKFITGLCSVCSWEYTFNETLLHKYTLLCEILKKLCVRFDGRRKNHPRCS